MSVILAAANVDANHPAADIYQKIFRGAINNLATKILRLSKGEICRMTDDEICDLLTANSNKIESLPKDEVSRFFDDEFDRLPKAERHRFMKADASTDDDDDDMFLFNAIMSFFLDEDQDLTLSSAPPYSSNIDTGKLLFIAGTCFYLLYGLAFITSQLHKWVLNLNKRLSSSKRDVNNITNIPPQERLKIISLSNYSKTPDRKGLKGIGKTHKGIRQLMIDPKSL